METAFDYFSVLIEKGLKNGMPRDAKLIILGEILYAVTRDELTNQQGLELEQMMGSRQEWDEALAYAIYGNSEEGLVSAA